MFLQNHIWRNLGYVTLSRMFGCLCRVLYTPDTYCKVSHTDVSCLMPFWLLTSCLIWNCPVVKFNSLLFIQWQRPFSQKHLCLLQDTQQYSQTSSHTWKDKCQIFVCVERFIKNKYNTGTKIKPWNGPEHGLIIYWWGLQTELPSCHLQIKC